MDYPCIDSNTIQVFVDWSIQLIVSIFTILRDLIVFQSFVFYSVLNDSRSTSVHQIKYVLVSLWYASRSQGWDKGIRERLAPPTNSNLQLIHEHRHITFELLIGSGTGKLLAVTYCKQFIETISSFSFKQSSSVKHFCFDFCHKFICVVANVSAIFVHSVLFS